MAPTHQAFISTGDIRAENATFIATGSEAAAIEGRNFIALKNCDMSGAMKWGVMIHQSFSGDAEGREGTFNMDDGSLSAAQGPLFFVNNAKGIIHLRNVKLSAASGVLVNAAASSWGRIGSNGGHVELTGESKCWQVMSMSIKSVRPTCRVRRIIPL